jgi:hypothetical protein
MSAHARKVVASALLMSALSLAASGCVPLNVNLRPWEASPPPPEVKEIAVSWNPEVFFEDAIATPGHPCAKQAGLMGRLYVLGENARLLTPAGKITVILYNDDAKGPGGEAVALEGWGFEAADLPRFIRKDTIGVGCTLPLPWGSYQECVRHVHFRVCYEPQNGPPLYTSSGPITLQHPESNYSAGRQIMGKK